ncbi:MAG: hypothetical protein WB586_30590 [Chthoniobacterales bacterium]
MITLCCQLAFSVRAKGGKSDQFLTLTDHEESQVAEAGEDRYDDPAVHPEASHGTRSGFVAVGQIQRQRGRVGSGLFEPEPFQPSISRHIRLLPWTLSAANAYPKIFAEAAALGA